MDCGHNGAHIQGSERFVCPAAWVGGSKRICTHHQDRRMTCSLEATGDLTAVKMCDYSKCLWDKQSHDKIRSSINSHSSKAKLRLTIRAEVDR